MIPYRKKWKNAWKANSLFLDIPLVSSGKEAPAVEKTRFRYRKSRKPIPAFYHLARIFEDNHMRIKWRHICTRLKNEQKTCSNILDDVARYFIPTQEGLWVNCKHSPNILHRDADGYIVVL